MPEPKNLHEQILAELTRRENATDFATPGPWMHVDYTGSITGEATFKGSGSVVTMNPLLVGGDIAAPSGDLYPRSGYSPKEDMAFIAIHNPVDARARYASARRVLGRHRPSRNEICMGCADSCFIENCPEIKDVALSISLLGEEEA